VNSAESDGTVVLYSPVGGHQYPMAEMMRRLRCSGRNGRPRGVDTIIMSRGYHHYSAWSQSHPAWTPSTTPARTPASQARGYVAGGVFRLRQIPWGPSNSERSEQRQAGDETRRDETSAPVQRPAIRSRCFLTLLSVQERPRLFSDSGSDGACACVLPVCPVGAWRRHMGDVDIWY